MVAGGAARSTPSDSALDVASPAARLAATLAWVSAVCALLGAVLVGVGVSALPHPWTHGYVSEGGVAGAGHATLYRIGIAALALSMGLLGLALARGPAPGRPPFWLRWWPLPWLSLVLGAAMGLVSSRVTCTRGCPLPPYQRTTFQDLVHAAASVGAVSFTALAILGIALIYPAGPLRRVARMATAICMPMLVALAVAIGVIGRGVTAGVLERISLAAVLLSAVMLAGSIGRGARRACRAA
jgi:hypothetical protein